MFASKDLTFAKAAPSSAYQISRSLRFRSSASAFLSRTPASAGNRQTWTWSGWVKRGALGAVQYLFSASEVTNNVIRFNADDSMTFYVYFATGATSYGLTTTTQLFRDPSAWYHIVAVLDAGNATNTDRLRLYVNNVRVTSAATNNVSSITQSTNGDFNQAQAHYISRFYSAGSQYFDGYLAEVNFIDGQALTPSSFGAYDATTGVWGPKQYTGTYGTNGFYLPFSDNSALTTASNAGLGKDFSGNTNYWVTNNISITAGVTYDSMIDSPTNYADGGNGRGNYATWNPLFGGNGSYLSQANLNFESASAYKATISTIGLPNSGLWYVEGTIKATGGSSSIVTFGVAKQNVDPNALGYNTTNAWSVTSETTFYAVVNGTASQSWSSGRWVTGEVARLAIDMNNGRMWVGNSTVWFGSTSNSTNGDPANGTNPTITGIPQDVFVWASNYANGVNVNFGQRPFSLTPPSGFSALNTQNLPTPTIPNGAQYMAATTWVGNGTSQTINNGTNTTIGTTFQPDFIWIKSRGSAYDHFLSDVVRGITTNYLFSDLTSAEAAASTVVTAVSSTGFTVGSAVQANENLKGIVGWQWNAGGAPTVDNSAGAGNVPTSGSVKINGANSTSALAGSIAATRISANTSAGFSVVTYTGTGSSATVGHGLGVAPSMVIVKNRSAVSDWLVWQSSLAGTDYLLLDATVAKATAAGVWNSAVPTSSVISVGTNGGTNGSTNNYVAYCFAAVAGYSAFGSYTGNGSADGPFVYCGFRPRFILTKRTDTTESWQIIDTSRDTYNQSQNTLYPNLSNAEATNSGLFDILSNGFKLKSTTTGGNTSGGTYIYMAFAENPFKYSLAR